MDSEMIKKWLVIMLGPALELTDSIAEKGFVGHPRWIEIGWQAEIEFLWGHQIPEGRFEQLEHFGDLVPLIEEFQQKFGTAKTKQLVAH